jgi:hypothetical protein
LIYDLYSIILISNFYFMWPKWKFFKRKNIVVCFEICKFSWYFLSLEVVFFLWLTLQFNLSMYDNSQLFWWIVWFFTIVKWITRRFNQILLWMILFFSTPFLFQGFAK